MSSWHAPQSIFHLNHRAVRDLFLTPVLVEEKVDGSFFAFGLFPEPAQDNEIVLKVRSKGAVMIPDAPMSMFRRATEGVIARKDLLHPGWMYRGECLDKPKHNALAYDRVPKDHVILFDVLTEEETYLSYDELVQEATRLGYEVVPQLFSGMVNSAEEFRKFLQIPSILGGQLIEGVVIKPLVPLYGQDKKLLMSKFVSEAYKEVHSKAWGESNPTSGDILEKLGKMYGTPTRWAKSVQHLREDGRLGGKVQDIGPLIKEVQKDVEMECKEEIQHYLWKFAWPHIQRMIIRELPTWYKEELMKAQFEVEGEGSSTPPLADISGGEHGVDPIARVDSVSDPSRQLVPLE